MSVSEDGEDMRLAFAMSLEHSSPAPPAASIEHAVIDLTSDTNDEDENLRRAIALSVQDNEQIVHTKCSQHSLLPTDVTTISRTETQSRQESSNVKLTTASSTTTPKLGFMGLDRKAMEQERLTRLNKRKRDPSPERPCKHVSRPPIAEAPQISVNHHTGSKAPALDYPKGAIKRTFATKYPRTDDISIDELLQSSTVNIAVISSFMWDVEWLHRKLDPRKVKQIWIMHAKGQDVQDKLVAEMKETGVPNLKIHFPPISGMTHSMHSKFMLLFGNDRLRFVVPTANMTQIDWGEVANNWQPAVMENSVFLIDLPRRADGQIGHREELTNFGKELVYFLEQQEIAQNVIEGLLKFDFLNTEQLAFVHSIGGSHKSELDHPTGLPSLAQAVQDLQLDHVKDIELDYAASSLGAINDNLLRRLHLAARGKAFEIDSEVPKVRDHVRIYFPTHETVEESVGGPDCGGIISVARHFYTAPTFPRECLRNYLSLRRGMLSHNKLLFARGRKNDGQPFAWIYIGSANISESAWGGQKVLKSGKMGALNIKNWECGVVMAVPKSKFEDAAFDEGELPPMAVFKGTIEVPFAYPGDRYGTKQPWFFTST